MARVVTVECIDEDPGRGPRWLAYDYDEDPCPIGRGDTEEAAVANLRSRIDANNDRQRTEGALGREGA